MNSKLLGAGLCLFGFLTCSEAPAQQVPPSGFARNVQLIAGIGKGRKVEGGDYDDRQETITVGFQARNASVSEAYQGYRGRIYIIGKNVVVRDRYRVLSIQDFTIDIPARGDVKWKGENVTTMYDRSGAKFGEAYEGYVIVFKDAQGGVASIRGTIAAFCKDAAKLDTLKQDGFYDSRLEPLTVEDRHSRRPIKSQPQ